MNIQFNFVRAFFFNFYRDGSCSLHVAPPYIFLNSEYQNSEKKCKEADAAMKSQWGEEATYQCEKVL